MDRELLGRWFHESLNAGHTAAVDPHIAGWTWDEQLHNAPDYAEADRVAGERFAGLVRSSDHTRLALAEAVVAAARVYFLCDQQMVPTVDCEDCLDEVMSAFSSFDCGVQGRGGTGD